MCKSVRHKRALRTEVQKRIENAFYEHGGGGENKCKKHPDRTWPSALLAKGGKRRGNRAPSNESRLPGRVK